MIIAIDGYEANVKNRVGIGQYAYEIIKRIYALRLRGASYDQVQFRIYLPDAPIVDMPKETSWWKYIVTGPKKLWTFIGLPLALMRDLPRASVVFSPTHYVPRFISIPRVMAIMDCSYLQYPELFRAKDLHQLIHWTKYAAMHTEAIFTISTFSKNAIIQAYQVDPRKVVVTYPGLVDRTTKLVSMQDIWKTYHIEKHYILSVGTIQPRKNYARLIEAFASFLRVNKQRFGKIDLVIVGKKGWIVEDILSAPKTHGVQDRVKFLDFVPDSDLPTLYKHALCFALPSLYEGFGLPVLEAMAEGCPVVVSKSSSLPEIAGKAGIYVDPTNVESITNGLLTAVRQRNLMQGKIRVKHGFEQVKKFNWDDAAKQSLDILTTVGKGIQL